MSRTLIDVVGGPYCGETWAILENTYKIEIPAYDETEDDATGKPIEWAIYEVNTIPEPGKVRLVWMFRGVTGGVGAGDRTT